MKLYRAVARENVPPNETAYRRVSTLRAPSNVPYLVDNLWEALRPGNMPSRRHAVYASPTAALALSNASSVVGGDSNAYCVFEVRIAGRAKVAHLDVTDARYHDDIRQLPKTIVNTLGKEFSRLSLAERAQVAPLFMPYMTKEDVHTLASQYSLVKKCLDEATCVSTFWSSASPTPNTNSKGELFFELDADALYYLDAIVRPNQP